MTNSEIKVGSKVVITDPGETYSAYHDMFKLLGFKDTGYNDSFSEGTVGTVFAIENKSKFLNVILCAVEDKNGNQCLIDAEGVKIISDPEVDLVVDPEVKFDVIKAFCTDMKLDVTSEDIYKYLLRKLS
jgi:hypothetical protein